MAVIISTSPLLFFVAFTDFRMMVLADNLIGLISVFPRGWAYLFTNYSISAILALGFFVGFVGVYILVGTPPSIQKYFGGIRRKEPRLGTLEHAKFRIWLNENPVKKSYWDWEDFMQNMSATVLVITILTGILYFFYLLIYASLYEGPWNLSSLFPVILVGPLILGGLLLAIYFAHTSFRFSRKVFEAAIEALYEQYLADMGQNTNKKS